MSRDGLGLVFDLDDTLYLECDFAASGFAAVGAFVAERAGIEGFAARCAALFSTGERTRIFDRALGEVAAPGVVAADLVAIYRAHRPQIALAPDAARCLARWRGPAGLITDGLAATQRNKIAALGIADAFAAVCVTGEWGAWFAKPHPRAFAAVAARLRGLGARRFVYVADNPAKDFVTPNAMGWRTVQVARPQRVHTGAAPSPLHAAHAVVASLDALDAALDDIAARARGASAAPPPSTIRAVA